MPAMEKLRTDLNQWSTHVKQYAKVSKRMLKQVQAIIDQADDRQAKIMIKMWEAWINPTEMRLLQYTNRLDDSFAIREEKIISRQRQKKFSKNAASQLKKIKMEPETDDSSSECDESDESNEETIIGQKRQRKAIKMESNTKKIKQESESESSASDSETLATAEESDSTSSSE